MPAKPDHWLIPEACPGFKPYASKPSLAASATALEPGIRAAPELPCGVQTITGGVHRPPGKRALKPFSQNRASPPSQGKEASCPDKIPACISDFFVKRNLRYVSPPAPRQWIFLEASRLPSKFSGRHLCPLGTEDTGWRVKRRPWVETPVSPARRGEAKKVAAWALQPWRLAGTTDLFENGDALAFAEVYHGHEPDRQGLAVLAAGTGWLPVVAGEPTEWRCALLRVLLSSGALDTRPPAGVDRLLMALRLMSGPGTWERRTGWALKALAAGADPKYLGTCLRWHRRHGQSLPMVPQNAVIPAPGLLRLLMRHGGAGLADRPAKAWHWLSLDRDGSIGRAARALLGKGSRIPSWGPGLFSTFNQADPATAGQAWRRALFIRLGPELLKVAAVMNPRNKSDCLEFVKAWIDKTPCAWPGMGDDLLFWLGRAARLNDSLFCQGSWFLACCCARLDTAGRALLRTWTHDQFRRFARLTGGWGYLSAVHLALEAEPLPREFLAAALHAHLREMVEILAALSQLRPELIQRLWGVMSEHPLCACKPSTTSLREALILMDMVAAGHEGVPDLPGSVRRLILTETGNAPSAEARMNEARRLVTRRWWHLAVRVMGQLVEWEIRRGYPGLRHDSGVDLHTLRMAMLNHELEENDAPTRLLVRAVDGGHGNRAWALNLPLNHQWLARHPAGSNPVWREGVAVAVTLPEAGEVILAFEDDLQEILKMGTRFGTCLSVGGCYGHSAAAVALDANKRVLYARERSGKVLARQLLALAEDGRLVCFAVYAHRHGNELRTAFSVYNHMLAQELRLPLWRGGDDYEVAPIVCPKWYDDGAWQDWRTALPLAS